MRPIPLVVRRGARQLQQHIAVARGLAQQANRPSAIRVHYLRKASIHHSKYKSHIQSMYAWIKKKGKWLVSVVLTRYTLDIH